MTFSRPADVAEQDRLLKLQKGRWAASAVVCLRVENPSYEDEGALAFCVINPLTVPFSHVGGAGGVHLAQTTAQQTYK